MPVTHHKKGTYIPPILRKGAVIIYGAKPPPSSKKKAKGSHSAFEQEASNRYRYLMLKLLDDTRQREKDQQALLESTAQENQEKPER